MITKWQQLPNADEEDKYQIRDCFIGSYNEEYGEDDDIISIDFINYGRCKIAWIAGTS